MIVDWWLAEAAATALTTAAATAAAAASAWNRYATPSIQIAEIARRVAISITHSV